MVDAQVAEVAVVLDEALTTVRLSGEVDFSAAETLSAASRQAIAAATTIRVDLTGLVFLDSIGAAFLAQLITAEAGQDRRLTVVGASHYISQTLQLSGLAPLIDFAPTQPETTAPR